MADELDREIERAFEIGKDNEEVIQLARNWCGHLKVVKSGGTGLIEVQTGLPIGISTIFSATFTLSPRCALCNR